MKVFVAFISNLYSFGCFAALTGLIIARLKEPTSSIRMTTNEESWFGIFFWMMNHRFILNWIMNSIYPNLLLSNAEICINTRSFVSSKYHFDRVCCGYSSRWTAIGYFRPKEHYDGDPIINLNRILIPPFCSDHSGKRRWWGMPIITTLGSNIYNNVFSYFDFFKFKL